MKLRRPRAKQRGFTQVSNVLEAALVMGWFVALVLGEKAMSEGTTARRTAEDSARASAAKSASAYCAPLSIDSLARISLSVDAKPKIDVAAALRILGGMGVGAERTYPYYVLPLLGIDVGAEMTAAKHRFTGARRLSCLERPLDIASGSLSLYRHAIWIRSLKGY